MLSPQEPLPAGQGQSVPTCRHHWVIEPAIGRVSQGQCQNCGEVREFQNFLEGFRWTPAQSRLATSPGVIADWPDEPDSESGFE